MVVTFCLWTDLSLPLANKLKTKELIGFVIGDEKLSARSCVIQKFEGTKIVNMVYASIDKMLSKS